VQGKEFFLDRAVSRTNELQIRLAALATAATTPDSISSSRQACVAAADERGIRCIFFTSLGAIFDFRATWDELKHARTWWYYVRRWHFWIFSDHSSRHWVESGIDESLACLVLDQATDWRDDAAVNALLTLAEARARRAPGYQLVCVGSAVCADEANR